MMAMTFSRDEHDRHKIPIFLKNVTVKVSKADKRPKTLKKKLLSGNSGGGGGTVFKVTVQYGDLSWIIYRRYWDFVKLHYTYKALATRTPKFPSIPRHRFRRHPAQMTTVEPQNDVQQNSTSLEPVIDEETVMALVSSTASNASHSSLNQIVLDADLQVLKAIEDYLNQFIASVGPTGHINRLCRFLEISTLGIQLSSRHPNAQYHGKEGFAFFQSRTDHDPKQKRKFLQDGFILPTTGDRRRRKPKWFIVRESYVVCIDDPSENKVYDVFLFDQQFNVHRLGFFGNKHKNHKKWSIALVNASHWTSKKSTLCLTNMQGAYQFRAKDEHQAKQFEHSIQTLSQQSVWCKPNRFDSFAPIRHNVPAAWFVDGRDYLWDVSVALDNAKECIYIHDWWLSPELFLRRPANEHQEWRLDRLLKRKADQNVKIYIIIYKEVAMALPLFSHNTKRHLLGLSRNIHVQRHPSRALDIFKKDNIFFWAHHEKICVVDHAVAFLGGIDQCFGRWDTPAHILVDDLPFEHQVWPGKDFSNPRIIDFHTLDKPFEDNQDRTRLPRMPWHDISMRVVGQSARDVARHFVQRWNYLRRKKPSAPKRPTPMLIPAPDAVLSQIDPRVCHPHTAHCDLQILRSVSPWSIGSTELVEHSIQNAYCDSIRNSNYFIYIVIENKIGDALFDRIVRAHKEGTKWKAFIVIPLVPGFPANIDELEATAVRLIMEYQFLSVNRGPDSLLVRLRAAGVENTHEYINFYGLRNWAELNGQFVTEQVYIHSKTMIVDDRIVIIGSANINERSLLGTRDSEIAAYVEDRELMDSKMDGKPVQVGRFAHTLRMRLMSEHVGLNVDELDHHRFQTSEGAAESGESDQQNHVNCIPPYIRATAKASSDDEKRPFPTDDNDLKKTDVSFSDSSSSSSEDEARHEKRAFKKHVLFRRKHKQTTKTQMLGQTAGAQNQLSPSSEDTSTSKAFFSKRKSLVKEDYLDFWSSLDPDSDNNGDHASTVPLEEPLDGPETIYRLLQDPLQTDFQAFWHMLARCNTDLFRKSFLVMPDNNVRTWDQYHHYIKMAKLFLGRIDLKHDGTKTTIAAATTLPFCGLVDEDLMVRQVLERVRGHLVIWPTHFMEEDNDEFLMTVDKLAPVEIFD
ncbi:MAG: hypothetical protein EXX96DRAFT_626299 [Benjaminiella poitrasii]|nr:MAG: hypothetical protein EXX96DRAFT_626299 [Benjaminiella poitrasii]